MIMKCLLIVLTHGFSTAHVTIERCVCIIPTIIYFVANGDSPAHGYNKKSHECDACKQILRPSHDGEKERERERDYCVPNQCQEDGTYRQEREINKDKNRTLIL